MKKRFISMLLTMCLVLSLLSTATLAVNVEDFTDLDKNEWYYDWVKQVVKKGYFIGTSETTFEPGTTMTRAMLVTVLYRMSGDRITLRDKPGFEDVAEDSWYADSVAWARKYNITKGVSATEFAPDEPVNREQMCTFIDRMINYMAQRGYVSFDHLKTHKVEKFADAKEISDWAVAAVDTCQAYGFVVGFPAEGNEKANTFRPADGFLRSQASKVVVMLADVLRGGQGNWDPPYISDYSYALEYRVWDTSANNGNGGYVDAGLTDSTTGTAASHTFTLTTAIIPGYSADGVDYEFIGWSDTMVPADRTGLLLYPDTVTVDANSSLTLYAVYAPTNDLVYNAVDATVADLQALAAKINAASVTVGGHTASMGTFDAKLTVSDLMPGTDAHRVALSAQATLSSSVVEQVIEIATTYAVSLLGSEPLPTRDEIADVVYDVVDQLGFQLEYQGIRAIADSVYSKLAGTAKDLAENFRNYGSNFCITAVDVENGKLVLTASDADGIIAGGATVANAKKVLSMVKPVAVSLAEDLYADLIADGGSREVNGMNVTDLNTLVTVKFTPAAGVKNDAFCYTYEFALNATLTSDLIAVKWDGSKMNVVLTITDGLQTQYVKSVNAIADALLVNQQAKELLSKEVKKALSGNSAFAALKTALDPVTVDTAINGAIDQWLNDNLTNGNADPAASYVYLYEYLWKNEGTIAFDGTSYSVAGGKVLGNNAALYQVVKTQLNQLALVAVDMVNDTIATDATYNAMWNSPLATDLDRFAVVKLGLGVVLDGSEYSALNADMKNYLTNLILVKFADNLNLADQVTAYTTALDAAEPKVDAYIDQMLMGSLYNLEFGGKTMNELFALLNQFKTIERMAEIKLSSVAALLELDLFQNVAAKANGYVQYVGKVIAKLPAGASVTLNGFVLNKAALADVADADTAAELCDALAALFKSNELKDLNVKFFGTAVPVMVQYGARTFTFGVQIVIE